MSLEADVGSPEAANNVVSLAETKSMLAAHCNEGKSDDVLIHVRFHPNSHVNTIDRCPAHLSPQDWFYLLCYAAPQQYQVFAGGRGFFRMQRGHFEAILSQSAT